MKFSRKTLRSKLEKIRLPVKSVFGEFQLSQMSLDFKTSCCNLEVRDLGASCAAFLFVTNYVVKTLIKKKRNQKLTDF